MTKQKYLTAAEVKAAKANPKGRQEIPAGVVPGLYLIIQPTGSKVWAFRYRHRGRTRKMTLGRYPYLSLSDARKVASEALAQVERLIDHAYKTERVFVVAEWHEDHRSDLQRIAQFFSNPRARSTIAS